MALSPWLGAAVAVVLAALLMGVAPSTASAYWEEAVLNPTKTDLTGPAKTIIENPTFLPDTEDGAAAYGGAAEASGAASVFEASTLLPALGAFGLGAVVGSEVCHVIGIEGCWQVTGTTPAETATGYSWEFMGATGEYPYTWRWTRGPATYWNEDGYCTSTSIHDYPSLADHYDERYKETVKCKTNGEGELREVVAGTIQPLRYSMEERSFAYSSTDTGMPNYEPGGKPYAASTEWSKKLATAIKGKPESTPAGRLGKHIASQIEGSGVPDPYPHKVTVPACSGEAWIECKADLEGLELVPERSVLTWETAEVELVPDAVTELAPAPSTVVETGSKVVVTTNPDKAGMPLVVPAPETGETYESYISRLAPGLNPERVNLPDSSIDPTVGANAVVRVAPVAGTRLNPEAEHSLEVQTNPPTAPPPGAGAGGAGTCNASVGSVDFSPLNQGLGSRFPFGVIGFFIAWVGEWSGSSYPDPEFEFTLVPAGVFGSSGLTVRVDFVWIEPAMEPIRIAFLLASFVGLLWFLGTAAMKVQGDAS